MADYRARLFMAGRFIRHQQILGTRPEGRSTHENSWEYPSQMPEGTTPGALNREPGGRRTNITTIREKPSGARGRGAVGSDGVNG
jgi:hypothetical protein